MEIITYFLSMLVFVFITACKSDEPTKPVVTPEMPVVEAVGDSNKIEIITWNIEHFPKNDYSDDYVKAIIEGLNADIYVLQEIQLKGKLSKMVGELDNYNYIYQTDNNSLNFAFIYKSDVVNVINSTHLFESDDHYFGSRSPFLVRFQWEKNGVTKDLSIIDVHLKCCGDNIVEMGNEDDEEYRRYRACEILHNYVIGTLNTENVIVAGDWNDAIQESETTNVFQVFIDDSTNFKFADWDIATGDAGNWSWQGWDSYYDKIHFDHILINKNLIDELNNSEVMTIKLDEYFNNGSKEYKENVSDHRPVLWKFIP